ncbi:MAG: hypothetical protein K6G04_06040 [Lachnospiraceae bacterium]|nr:hypothetical protein [Lachnospiraceae bacterium]
METIRLFDQDAYATTFQSRVSSVTPVTGSENCYEIILEQTLFFPEEGGQSPDLGTLGEGQVQNVQIHDNIITHTVCFHGPAPAVSDTITGTIDWDHRFSNMQNHSGEHIFSGIVHRLFGFENVGFHLSDNSVTMDYNGILSPEDIRRVEHLANEAIYENIAIQCDYPDEATLAALDYRSKKELSGPIRIVTIPGIDVCACCAPHVHRTGEIGLLKVIASQKYKGGIRLNILCGHRAMAHYTASMELLQNLSHRLSAGVDQLPEFIDRLTEDNRLLSGKLRDVSAAQLNKEIAGVDPDAKHVFLFTDAVDHLTLRNGVNALVSMHSGFCGIFCASKDGFSYIVGSASLDSREVGNVLRASFAAKGGGKPEMIQGSIQGVSSDALAAFLAEQFPS